jgi:hypothetical protein
MRQTLVGVHAAATSAQTTGSGTAMPAPLASMRVLLVDVRVNLT